VQQLQLLCHKLAAENGHSGRIAARPAEACDKPGRNRICSGRENDRNGFGRRN
jgi:hypothetical protein